MMKTLKMLTSELMLCLGQMMALNDEDSERKTSEAVGDESDESFLCDFLLTFVRHKLDPALLGGVKGSSTTHCLIYLIDFILTSWDQSARSVLLLLVDWSKGFNRVSHHTLIEILFQLEVPAWLLRIIFSYLKGRKMQLRHRGKLSSIHDLPGGLPQGALLSVLLFIIYTNFSGLPCEYDASEPNNTTVDAPPPLTPIVDDNELRCKYIDDLSCAEMVHMKNQTVKVVQDGTQKCENWRE